MRWMVLPVLFFFLYFFLGAFNYFSFGVANGSSDFLFHWQHLQGIDSREYAPAFYLLFALFAPHQLLFFTAGLALVWLAIPFLLKIVSGSGWPVAVYALGVSLPHQAVYGATFPSALVFALFLGYLAVRERLKYPYRGILLVILLGVAPFLHSFALPLFFCVLVAEFLRLIVGSVFPVVLLVGQKIDNARALLNVFLVQIPLPVFLLGARGLQKNLFYAMLTVFSFAGAMIDFRAIGIAQLLFCLAAGPVAAKLSPKWKKAFLFYLLAQGTFFFLDFGGGMLKIAALSSGAS